jgi:hypothetical protein
LRWERSREGGGRELRGASFLTSCQLRQGRSRGPETVDFGAATLFRSASDAKLTLVRA